MSENTNSLNAPLLKYNKTIKKSNAKYWGIGIGIGIFVIVTVIVYFLWNRAKTVVESTNVIADSIKEILPPKLDCSTCKKKMDPFFLIPETDLCNSDYTTLPCTELVDDIWKLRKQDCSGENCPNYTGSYKYDESNDKQCKKPKTHSDKLELVKIRRGRVYVDEWRYKQDYPDLQKIKGDIYSGEWKFENCGNAAFTCNMDNGINCSERTCESNTNTCTSEIIGNLDGISFNKDGYIINE